MKGLLVGALIAAALAVTSPSQARSTHSVVVAKHRYYHARGVVRWIGAHAAVTQYHPNPQKKHHWQAAVKFWIKVRDDAWRTLHPAPQVLLPPHDALWECIHAKEGDWKTGYNPAGPFYAGLQMTWGWGELSGDPRNYSALQQKWAAEHEWAKHNYAMWFLRQQWPNTSYGCA